MTCFIKVYFPTGTWSQHYSNHDWIRTNSSFAIKNLNIQPWEVPPTNGLMIVFRLFLTAYLNTLPVRSYCRMLTIFLWSVKHFEQVERIELSSPDWKSGVMAIIRYLLVLPICQRTLVWIWYVNINIIFQTRKLFSTFFKKVINNLSSRQDSNLRAPHPKCGEINLTPLLLVMVDRDGFEPPTLGSSGQRSTNWATDPGWVQGWNRTNSTDFADLLASTINLYFFANMSKNSCSYNPTKIKKLDF